MFKKIASMALGALIAATPVLAATPIENLIVGLRAIGFQLVLLWLLTLAIVYGVLSHIEVPKSTSARSVISIVSAFMVLLAAAAFQTAIFVSNLITAGVAVAFSLMILMVFLEITGAKYEGVHIFSKHPRFFGAVLIVVLISIFLGAGGSALIPATASFIRIDSVAIATILFLVVMVAAIWVFYKDTGGK